MRQPRAPYAVIVVQNLSVPRDRRVWREALALAAAGWRVTVIAPRGAGEPAREHRDGVDLLRYRPAPDVPSAAAFVWETAYSFARTAALLVAACRRGVPDVLQACNPPETYWVLGRLLRPLGVRFVFDHHDLSPEVFDVRFARQGPGLGSLVSRWTRRALLLLERTSVRAADAVVATNESIRGIDVSRGGAEPGRVVVVRNGPEPDRMVQGDPRPALREGRKHLACYVGVLGRQDGVETVLDVAEHYVRELQRDDCLFVLAGDGEQLAPLRADITRRGLDDVVRTTGWLDDDELFAYLSTADVGLCPEPATELNHRSTMIKTTEYLSFSLPVVSFDLVETRRSAGEAGVFVPPGDHAAFAEAIAGLLDDAARRERLGALGRARVEGELGWPTQARRYVALFERLRRQSPVASPQPRPEQGVHA